VKAARQDLNEGSCIEFVLHRHTGFDDQSQPLHCSGCQHVGIRNRQVSADRKLTLAALRIIDVETRLPRKADPGTIAQILNRCRQTYGSKQRRCSANDPLVVTQLLGDKRTVCQASDPDCTILSLFHQRHKPVDSKKLDGQIRIGPPETAQNRHDEPRQDPGRHGCAQVPAQAGRAATDLKLSLLQIVQDDIHPFQKKLPLVCQAERAAVAVKQRHVQRLLKLGNTVACRGCRNAKLTGGRRNARGFGDSDKGLQVRDAVHSKFSNAAFEIETVLFEI